ncbi:MAG: serine/threonine-protein kinase, partial [Gemmatimonadales bacterium]
MKHQKPPQDPVDHIRQRLSSALAGRYVIEGPGGWGGMALVFKARDLRHTRMVAIKVVRPELLTTSATGRFLDEVRLAGRLQHPHIVPVYDSGEADGLVYFVMPYIQGETLHERLNHRDSLPLTEALAVARDVADALGAAHEAGIIHRDIKPENILLSGSHALVADFGVALAVDRRSGEGHTDPGFAVGTYAYMSPEQASPSNGVDGRTDVYALACVLYEMLSGQTPWPDIKDRLYGGVATREMRPIAREDVPASIQQALAKGLALRPADRYATIGDFADALGLSGVQRGTLPPPRGRIPTWLTAAAALTISAGAVTVGLAVGSGADSGRYVVAPCTGDTAIASGEYCQWRIAEALAQWDAVRLVDPYEAVDVLRRSGLDRADSDSWYRVAVDARAGRLVRADLTQVGDTTFLVGQLLDGSRRRPVGPSHRVLFAIGEATRSEAFPALVSGLLGLGDATREPGILGTRTVAAGRAYAEGRAALAAGDLETAHARFAEAARTDPTFGDAAYWQAQLGAWLGLPLMEFQLAAERAYAFRESLRDPSARQLVAPLADLSRRAYDEACDGYRALTRADSAGFSPWLGLADCLLRDPIAVPSAASPSGYVFRASFEEARRAMQAALVREPGLIAAMWPR